MCSSTVDFKVVFRRRVIFACFCLGVEFVFDYRLLSYYCVSCVEVAFYNWFLEVVVSRCCVNCCFKPCYAVLRDIINQIKLVVVQKSK